ncbi:uncharacterized protein LOC127261746 [Andrographis paniculata]|uniref:uncharacterized protein LOC127261746 n=1 Tax=Andrographis paniculata TaxID=175694 RepID=UPI0021E70852|nr:uncharacterized protein LOC127261746 [Andrographis paniculata]
MGKAEDREELSGAFNELANAVRDFFQVFDHMPFASLKKSDWKEVIELSDALYRHATTVGFLCTADTPGVTILKEAMSAHINALQSFLLVSHGSTVGAGPTLFSCIRKNSKQVVDTTLMLLKEVVSAYGSESKSRKDSIPQLVGVACEACNAVKKTPTTNVTAVGRAMTEVSISVKDVLRELKELKPASYEPPTKSSGETSTTKTEDKSNNDAGSCDGDLGSNLSPEEMKIAEIATTAVSELLAVMKELIRCITAMLRRENAKQSSVSVDSLEKLLKLCQGISAEVDNLGACLYPPQEIPAIIWAVEKISLSVEATQTELQNLKGSTKDFTRACDTLKSSLTRLSRAIGSEGDDGNVLRKLENLDV